MTFDPSVALDYETVEFLAFGHPLVDAIVERVRGRAFGSTTAHRYIADGEQVPRSGWFFTFVLEFEGVTRSKELLPVFVTDSGVSDPDTAVWLLERSSLLRHEDRPVEATDPPTVTADVLRQADEEALDRLIARRAELNAVNRTRLEQERAKLERYFDYRQRAAAEKLQAVQRTLDNVSMSDDVGVQRIIPVWAKNLENARRVSEGLAAERLRRVAELVGRDQVAAQHEMLTGAFVAIVPGSGRPQESSAS